MTLFLTFFLQASDAKGWSRSSSIRKHLRRRSFSSSRIDQVGHKVRQSTILYSRLRSTLIFVLKWIFFHLLLHPCLSWHEGCLKCILLPILRIITREFMDYKWINSWQNKARFYRAFSTSGSISNSMRWDIIGPHVSPKRFCCHLQWSTASTAP